MQGLIDIETFKSMTITDIAKVTYNFESRLINTTKVVYTHVKYKSRLVTQNYES